MDRTAIETVTGERAIDGAGVHLVRVLGAKTAERFNPFLLLDAFDSRNPDDYTKGFPWHPHRGIETITYLAEGFIEHGDNLGNGGVITGGSCQWMTAGGGIIHQEMPLASERMLGLQIWLNIPAKDKMCAPAYHDLTKERITEIREEGSVVRVISGTYKGVEGAMRGSYIDATILAIHLEPAAHLNIPVASDDLCFIYGMEGSYSLGSTAPESFIASRRATLLSDGDRVTLTASADQGAHIVLCAAPPLGEPIAWGGPIVMNTREELQSAFAALDNGTFIKK